MRERITEWIDRLVLRLDRAIARRMARRPRTTRMDYGIHVAPGVTHDQLDQLAAEIREHYIPR